MTIRELFASDIDRRIEEVIKVDQTDDEILRGEIDEYVVTDAIREHYTGILHAYQEAPNNPHEGIGSGSRASSVRASRASRRSSVWSSRTARWSARARRPASPNE